MIVLLTKRHLIFRVVWRGVNLLLVTVMVSSLYAGVREYSVRRYLDGFSDAIVPNSLPEEEKLAAILRWMRAEPSRATSRNGPQITSEDHLAGRAAGRRHSNNSNSTSASFFKM